MNTLTLQEQAIVVRMWCVCHQTGTLPDDPVQVSRLIGVNPKTLRSSWDHVRIMFTSSPDDPGVIRSSRLDDERMKSEKRRDGFVRGANKTNELRYGGSKVTPSLSERPKNIEIEREEDIEQEVKNNTPLPPKGVQQVVDTWNRITEGKLPKAKLTPKRQSVIQARLREKGWMEDFTAACSFLVATPWYQGQNDKAWTATLDFALQPGKATQLAEKAQIKPPTPTNGAKNGIPATHRFAERDAALRAQFAAERTDLLPQMPQPSEDSAFDPW